MNIGQHTWFSIGVALLLIATCAPLCVSSASLSRAPSPTIDWEVQVNTTGAFFQGVSMCKGTTQGTERAGFVASATGSIWRTLDGVHWEQVNQSPEAAFWIGIFCFPDAQRVIAVGTSNGNGGIISWSFDGGATWSDPEPMPESGSFTWVQAVHFYNDTDGIILPYRQDSSYVAYYTTSGGKTASDWQVVQLEEPYVWGQSHPIWAFGDVTKTLSYNGSAANLCSSGSAGMSWNCQAMNAAVAVGSFASPDVAIGVDYGLSSFYSTADGGYTWNWTSALPFDLSRSMLTPSDMLWVPNSDVVILVGGTNNMGSIVHSTDLGATWGSSMPELPSTSFNSVDFVAVSETKTEVWAVGANENSAVILHATVFTSGDLRLSGQW